MLSPSITAPERLAPVPANQDSSTDFRSRKGMTWAALARTARIYSSEFGEVALFTKASPDAKSSSDVSASRAWMTERNESVSARIIPIRNPNRKDSLKTPIGLLLKDPNTSEIKPSADRSCQQSVITDGQVMDRGAEGAAGGYDAI